MEMYVRLRNVGVDTTANTGCANIWQTHVA